MQSSEMKLNAIQCNAEQCNATLSLKQSHAVECKEMKCSIMESLLLLLQLLFTVTQKPLYIKYCTILALTFKIQRLSDVSK